MVSRTSRFRGSRTHGRGKKKGRGAGLRGGRGHAGLHKHKYISIVKYDPDYFGRHGFKRPQSVVRTKVTLNLSDLEEGLERFLASGIAVRSGEKISIDLGKLGVEKLLGSGKIARPVRVIVAEASERAKEKLKAVGGELATPEAAPEPQA